MKAMVAHGDVPGGRLEYSDWPDPTAGPTDVVLQVGAAGVNYTDLLLRRGMIGRLPAIPGIDAAGTVVARGHQVDDIAIGTRVIVNPATSCDRCEYCLSGNHGTCRQRRAIGQALDGSYAQFLRIPRSNVYQIRDDLSLEEAAAMPVAFFTAWQMLMMRAKMRPGECVLIAGAAGGVGSAAVQIAKLAGARIIAAAGSDAKLTTARLWGADEGINYSSENLGERLLDLTGGGADVVLDTIGGSMWEHYMKGLRAGGRLVTCSLTTGRDPKLDLVAILSKQLTIYGTGGSGSKSAVATVVKLINERRLLGVVDRIMDLKSADQAHDLIQNRAISGKVVLKP